MGLFSTKPHYGGTALHLSDSPSLCLLRRLLTREENVLTRAYMLTVVYSMRVAISRSRGHGHQIIQIQHKVTELLAT